MKRSLFYIFMALVYAACILAGCSKSAPAGPEPEPVVEETANCYIISEAGDYRIQAVKGNSREPVGEVSAVEVLWETFGTDTAPQPGDLIAQVSYDSDKNTIAFSTGAEFLKGNAAIAAKDAEGTILWSWHIWMTDKPKDQAYNNGAGTMMDRNLGATSATPGSVGALGLLYQWGRKDPFPGASSISENIAAKATLVRWPQELISEGVSIDYTVQNPTKIISTFHGVYDWLLTEDGSMDNTRWQAEKTIYDPCPAGYRVPDGGENGVWAKAFGTTSDFKEVYDGTKAFGTTSDFKEVYDGTNKGFNFGASGESEYKLTEDPDCWYPFAGEYYMGDYSNLYDVGEYFTCCSCTTQDERVGVLMNAAYNEIRPSFMSQSRSKAVSVRCMKEE